MLNNDLAALTNNYSRWSVNDSSHNCTFQVPLVSWYFGNGPIAGPITSLITATPITILAKAGFSASRGEDQKSQSALWPCLALWIG